MESGVAVVFSSALLLKYHVSVSEVASAEADILGHTRKLLLLRHTTTHMHRHHHQYTNIFHGCYLSHKNIFHVDAM